MTAPIFLTSLRMHTHAHNNTPARNAGVKVVVVVEGRCMCGGGGRKGGFAIAPCVAGTFAQYTFYCPATVGLL